ncbi:DUF4163 domain-containing protein [Erythrobacter dokdonensis DSW-74]|uniref:DUF4163 domain-containing protein n=2 Tax=Erythrobacter TaxID=1041 RepID=A0A1A7BFW1_9SPHN|nr:DUF4163 domain-containing protein [Erythrobacter dokdonensis DSW-74]
MHGAMFHMKHPQGQVWQGSSGGLARAGAGLALAIGLLGAGCSSPEDMAGATASAEAAASTGSEAVAFADNAEKDGGKREFAYAWPAEVSAIPALAESLAAERDTALAGQKSDWDTALAEFAGEDCAGCKSLSYSKEWQVVADLPRYLSLSADIYLYTGGAHGNSDFEGLVWDREAGAAIAPEAMFTSQAALQDALGEAWCYALKIEKKTRLGADFSDDGFFPCPPVSDLTLLAGSAGKAAFDRIGLIAAPYVAGSYAEGPYEVTLPVTQAVLDAVKPEYKAAFAPGK